MIRYLRNLIGLLLFIGWIYLMFFAPLTQRKLNKYVRITHRDLYYRLLGADCNLLVRELNLAKVNSEESRLITWIEYQMREKECN